MDPHFLMVVVAKGETVVEPKRKRILVAVVCASWKRLALVALAAGTVTAQTAVPGWPKSGCTDGCSALFVVLVDDYSCSSCYCYCSFCEAKRGYWRLAV
jgi:hypothetical protein